MKRASSEASLDNRFAIALHGILGESPPACIGLAVSGGGDSMALLCLADRWARQRGVILKVATVDHGLRAESATEAAFVAKNCAKLGWRHDILSWNGWDGSGNLQQAARQARHRLLAEWAAGLEHIALGHTRDDQAETFLMRLARGSGVDGLSAMGPVQKLGSGPDYIRPLLEMTRDELRAYLTDIQVSWVEDPSNEDRGFERVRIRHLMPLLAEAGMGRDRLADTAAAMRRAREALTAEAYCVGQEISEVVFGDVMIARAPFSNLALEIQLRLLSGALSYVAGNPLRPRLTALETLCETLRAGGAGTLHGAYARANKKHIRISREYKAVAQQCIPAVAGAIWDHRWRIGAGFGKGAFCRPLGTDGIERIGKHKESPLPFHSLRAQPAVFEGDALVCCPAFAIGPPDGLTLASGPAQFPKNLLIH